ncbi:PREDICTED: U7 snRNA-associated Sm-like protein LSm11 [Cyphomyrmex costatus]|uniref:U7 snRNA-associated Sm-like protein LSm11 n=1 Tax=Cyphomyrmex costatus TaxID=456900 RepID=A0A195CNQ6_9HYME|nr:PREDICTED: U7 snRNA-associated Sm-like protein LSm11 [Cyphomyrmex costatus]KYN02351.1 U7 snRNA-associated Sm-like protein LSm11 [Cyphomyrmex costatus]
MMADQADEDSETSDESLDVRSEKFDPLKALYSPKVRLAARVPIYDNISKFESVLKGIDVSTKSDKSAVPESSRERRFLSHQEPVSRKRRERKDILSKMQNILGPLGMLHGCMENKIRIRVYTRNAHGIRGHVEAYVAAFDKFWNLALEDCFEVWSRKVKRKAPAVGPDAVRVEPTEKDVPKVVVKKIEGKTETLERHVPQMLLRGEQVAIIVKIN